MLSDFLTKGPFQVSLKQLKVSSSLLKKPYLIIALFGVTLPCWLFLAVFNAKSISQVNSLKLAFDAIELGQKSSNNLFSEVLFAASEYMMGYFVGAFALGMLFIYAYYALSMITFGVIKEKKIPPLTAILKDTLYRGTLVFFGLLLLLLVGFIWIKLSQIVLNPIAGIAIPLGIIYLCSVFFMLPITLHEKESGLYFAFWICLPFRWSKQGQYSLLTVVLHLMNILILAYLLQVFFLFTLDTAHFLKILYVSSLPTGKWWQTWDSILFTPLWLSLGIACTLAFLAYFTTQIYALMGDIRVFYAITRAFTYRNENAAELSDKKDEIEEKKQASDPNQNP